MAFAHVAYYDTFYYRALVLQRLHNSARAEAGSQHLIETKLYYLKVAVYSYYQTITVKAVLVGQVKRWVHFGCYTFPW